MLELEHDKSVSSTAFSPDGKYILTVDPDVSAPILWDAETGEEVQRIETADPVAAAAFSPDGRQIVGGGTKIQVWDAETGNLILTLPGVDESWYISSPVISSDGNLLAAPGYPARVYDLDTQKELFALPQGARTVAFSPDSAQIATAGYDAVGVWDAETGELIFLAGHVHGADAVAWNPDGRLLVTGGPDGRFRIWDAATGAELWNGLAVTLWWEDTD